MTPTYFSSHVILINIINIIVTSGNIWMFLQNICGRPLRNYLVSLILVFITINITYIKTSLSRLPATV